MLWIEFKLKLKLSNIEGQLLLPPVGTWLAFQIISPICFLTSSCRIVSWRAILRQWGNCRVVLLEHGCTKEEESELSQREREWAAKTRNIWKQNIFPIPCNNTKRFGGAARTDGGDAAKFPSTPSLPPHYKNIPQQPREVRLVWTQPGLG